MFDAGPAHVSEVGVPLLFAPVPVRNVVADLVREGPWDLHGIIYSILIPVCVKSEASDKHRRW